MQTKLQPLTQYQKRKLRQAKEEKQIQKKLVFLTQNKFEILFEIRQYKKKHFNNYRNNYVHACTVAKLLQISKHTVLLMAKYKYISSFALCNNLLFNLTEVRDFVKSL